VNLPHPNVARRLSFIVKQFFNSAPFNSRYVPVSSYYIALINIHDPARYQQYLAGFDEVFEKFQGEVIAIEDNPRVLEGKWPAGRTVIIRFPNDQAAHTWYESPEYQQLAHFQQEASVASVTIVTGRNLV
jgi:uncharacterized protein (DUF1330 family)